MLHDLGNVRLFCQLRLLVVGAVQRGYAIIVVMAYTLYATRHPQTVYNTEHRINGSSNLDTLTDEGRQQQIPRLVAALGNLSVNFTALYSSPLDRAMEAAHALGKYLGLEVRQDERLIEVNAGSFTGQPWEATVEHFGKASPQLLASCNYDFTDFGGESSDEVEQRVLSFVEEQRARGEIALNVSHGGVLYIMHKLSTGQPGAPLPNATIYPYAFPD